MGRNTSAGLECLYAGNKAAVKETGVGEEEPLGSGGGKGLLFRQL